MTSGDNLVRIPTRMLRKGLYVRELDRPWTDLPVVLQGLEIRTDEEIAMLQAHCRFVYVQPERSEQQEDLVLDSSELTPPTDITETMGGGRLPDFSRFAEGVRQAARQRAAAAQCFEEALEQAREGHWINPRAAQPTVSALASDIALNGSAAMWLTTLRNKDSLHATHSVNVCVLSLTLATYIGLPGEQVEEIGLGALLHDLGKVKVPRRMLSKKGELTDEELGLIKLHPSIGRKMISSDEDMTRWVRDIIHMHHEKLDGSGYPQGLAGDELPRHVRLVALANAYEKMTSERYDQPLTPDQALGVLYNEAPTTYGQEMVQALIQCVGIYPMGSLVELDNGALAIVIGSSRETRLRPVVLLIRSPRGAYYNKRVVLNLAVDDADSVHGDARQVKRVLRPSEYGIDVSGIVAFEFGLDYGEVAPTE